jgi:hypothetical protein
MCGHAHSHTSYITEIAEPSVCSIRQLQEHQLAKARIFHLQHVSSAEKRFCKLDKINLIIIQFCFFVHIWERVHYSHNTLIHPNYYYTLFRATDFSHAYAFKTGQRLILNSSFTIFCFMNICNARALPVSSLQYMANILVVNALLLTLARKMTETKEKATHLTFSV